MLTSPGFHQKTKPLGVMYLIRRGHWLQGGKVTRERISHEWGAWMDEVYLISEKNNTDQNGIQCDCVKKTEKGWVDNNALYWSIAALQFWWATSYRR